MKKVCFQRWKFIAHAIVLNLDKRITVFYTEGLYRKWSFLQQKKPSAIHDEKKGKETGKGNQLSSLDRIPEILSEGEPIENIDLALISSSDEASASESDEE